MQRIIETLQSMMGPRQRCMYCVDSHGSDIEHFGRKLLIQIEPFMAKHAVVLYRMWKTKRQSISLSDDGLPLLVDPSIENPWDYLDFDPDTGNIISRYIADLDIPSERANIQYRFFNWTAAKVWQKAIGERIDELLPGGQCTSGRCH